MDQEIKQKWIDALRSGQYEQGRLTLKRFSGLDNEKVSFCCLGVLCDLVDPLGWYMKIDRFCHNGLTSYPAKNILNDCGFPEMDGILGELVNMNDNLGKSFNEIADWIEKNL